MHVVSCFISQCQFDLDSVLTHAFYYSNQIVRPIRSLCYYLYKVCKKLSYYREAGQCFVILNIYLNHSTSFNMTPFEYGMCKSHCLCLVPFLRYSASNNGIWLGVIQGN